MSGRGGACYDSGRAKVPGRGEGDHIRALLEPGEAVVAKAAAEQPGRRAVIREWNHEAKQRGRDSR